MDTDDHQLITDALRSAVKAPSPYNTQPWRFVVDGPRIDLLLDTDRVLGVADPEAREARLACGAALFNLRLGIRAHGRTVTELLLPEPDRPELLASVRIGATKPKTLTEDRLARAVHLRHTNRRPYLERAVETPLRTGLVAAARAEDAVLELIDASARYTAVADLIRQADSVQRHDQRYQEEFRRWTGGADGRPDGVPTASIGPAPDTDRVLTLRHFHRDDAVARRTFEQQPLLAAVATYGSGPVADVTAGVAMQRVLLTACDLGLATSFLSQPFEVPETRESLGQLFWPRHVHTLLRIGYGYPLTPTPRRPVHDVAAHF